MGFPLPLLPRASGLDSWSCFLSQPPAKPESFAPASWTHRHYPVLLRQPWRLLTQEGRGGLCPWVSPASFSLFFRQHIYTDLLGFGWGGGERAKPSAEASTEQHLSGASSWLVVVVQTPLRPPGPHSPKLPGASLVLLRSLVRGTSCFLCSGCSQQKVRDKGQEMGWCV